MVSYLQWFNDVFSTEISTTCEDVLNGLSEKHGCQVCLHASVINIYSLVRVQNCIFRR